MLLMTLTLSGLVLSPLLPSSVYGNELSTNQKCLIFFPFGYIPYVGFLALVFICTYLLFTVGYIRSFAYIYNIFLLHHSCYPLLSFMPTPRDPLSLLNLSILPLFFL